MHDTVSALQCPDCSAALPVRFALLTADYRIVLLTTCPICADKISVRCFKVVERPVFIEASLRGLPTIKYGRRDA